MTVGVLPDAGPGSDSSVNLPPGTGKVTLSGAVTATVACMIEAVWSAPPNGSPNGDPGSSAVIFTTTTGLPASIAAIAGGGTATGMLTPMTYPVAAFTQYQDDVAGSGGNGTSWETTNTKPNGGTQTLVITSATVTTNAGSAMIYAIHGTFDATMPYESGPTGMGTTVKMHIDF
jgi:hypothetical protein